MAEITVNQLNKYYSDFHLLQDISFEVYPGQRVGIVGPNGCGKTTLFNILTGKEPYDSGELSLREGARVALLDQLPEYPAMSSGPWSKRWQTDHPGRIWTGMPGCRPPLRLRAATNWK